MRGVILQPIRLVLFCRYPHAGECKTRLVPALGANGAAAVHRQLTERTAAILERTGAPFTVAYTGGSADEFAIWLGSVPEYKAQCDGGLGERLAVFAERAPVIMFGSDTPDLAQHHVAAAMAGLATHDAVIGPAADGGYYLVGMREPLLELFTDMPWSTDQVLPETLRRLERLGIEPLLLETLPDCDRPKDLDRWPDLAMLSEL